MTTIDVAALVADAKAPEGQGCHTCQWLKTRDPVEAAQWGKFLALDVHDLGNAQLARAMRAADDGSPGEASLVNHRKGHSRNRTDRKVRSGR